MCFINHLPPDYMDEPASPGPRPAPQLKWVVPVDIVALGASLEALLKQTQQITTLRLCHRFGNTALSSLPQEILDQIISETYRTAKLSCLPKWDQKFRCFQGRCNRDYHEHSHDLTTEYLWRSNYVERRNGVYEGEALNPDDYTEEEKREMVEDQIEEDEYESWDDGIVEDHWDTQADWLDLLCRCKKPINRSKVNVPFPKLAGILRTHFGLDAVILHESLSDKLRKFLPDNFGPSMGHYSTTCFLTLAPMDEKGPFLPEDNHLAYYKPIDVSAVHLTEGQNIRFARAIRELDLKPHFHLSELEELIKPTNSDKALWNICDRQIAGCPKPSEAKRRDKRKLLREYLNKKHKSASEASPGNDLSSIRDVIYIEDDNDDDDDDDDDRTTSIHETDLPDNTTSRNAATISPEAEKLPEDGTFPCP
ncbi:hypothetical protein FB567DRAFT_589847 [Paraphoma chrysanthemicola]|uniref:Uncharacterized protein n=1 Tax=Paraphoma chrysanthemicola TaxID=798071 RepID=A0A8K0W1E0_9PLEO|nr:hypothetical protein FB567DRAFT_589847 [Paraphoma chrysanthemicola]